MSSLCKTNIHEVFLAQSLIHLTESMFFLHHFVPQEPFKTQFITSSFSLHETQFDRTNNSIPVFITFIIDLHVSCFHFILYNIWCPRSSFQLHLTYNVFYQRNNNTIVLVSLSSSIVKKKTQNKLLLTLKKTNQSNLRTNSCVVNDDLPRLTLTLF